MALFGYQNTMDGAATTLVASSEIPGFLASMLRVPLGSSATAWQTAPGVTSASLTITAAVAVAWRALCLARTNLTTAATIRVRVGTVANVLAAPLYDSGTISAGVAVGIGQALHVLPAATSALVMVVNIADPANPDGFLSIPLAYAGPGIEAAISYTSDTGLEVRRADTTTRGGVVLTQPLSRARGWSLTLPMLRDSNIAWLDALEAVAAAGGNLLFVPRVGNALAAAESVFGLLQPGRRGFVSGSGHYRSWTATISERL